MIVIVVLILSGHNSGVVLISSGHNSGVVLISSGRNNGVILISSGLDSEVVLNSSGHNSGVVLILSGCNHRILLYLYKYFFFYFSTKVVLIRITSVKYFKQVQQYMFSFCESRWQLSVFWQKNVWLATKRTKPAQEKCI